MEKKFSLAENLICFWWLGFTFSFIAMEYLDLLLLLKTGVTILGGSYLSDRLVDVDETLDFDLDLEILF